MCRFGAVKPWNKVQSGISNICKIGTFIVDDLNEFRFVNTQFYIVSLSPFKQLIDPSRVALKKTLQISNRHQYCVIKNHSETRIFDGVYLRQVALK